MKWFVNMLHGVAGSRVHIFHFLEKDGALQLQKDTFEQLKPGLSSFPDNPKQAAESLKPLIDKALATVPEHLQVCESLSLF